MVPVAGLSLIITNSGVLTARGEHGSPRVRSISVNAVSTRPDGLTPVG